MNGNTPIVSIERLLQKAIAAPTCGGQPDIQLKRIRNELSTIDRPALLEGCWSLLLNGTTHEGEIDWLILWGAASAMYQLDQPDIESLLTLRADVIGTYGHSARIRVIDFLIAAVALQQGVRPPHGIKEACEQTVYLCLGQ